MTRYLLDAAQYLIKNPPTPQIVFENAKVLTRKGKAQYAELSNGLSYWWENRKAKNGSYKSPDRFCEGGGADLSFLQPEAEAEARPSFSAKDTLRKGFPDNTRKLGF